MLKTRGGSAMNSMPRFSARSRTNISPWVCCCGVSAIQMSNVMGFLRRLDVEGGLREAIELDQLRRLPAAPGSRPRRTAPNSGEAGEQA